MSRTRMVGALVGALLVLGACSDDPKPKFAPPSETPSPSTDPAESQDATPTARDQQRKLIARSVSAFSAAISTGDGSAFKELGSPDCQNCQVLVTNLENAYRGGGSVKGGSWTLAQTNYVARQPLGLIWNVDVETTKERWFNGQDDLVKIVRAGTLKFAFALTRDGQGWQIREVRFRSK